MSWSDDRHADSVLYNKRSRSTLPKVIADPILGNMRYKHIKTEIPEEDGAYHHPLYAVKPDGSRMPINDFIRAYAAAAVEKALNDLPVTKGE